MEYTLFQDFARKIPRPAEPTGRPGPAPVRPYTGLSLIIIVIIVKSIT